MKILLYFPHRNALNPISGDTTRSWNIIRSLINNNFDVSIFHNINSKGLEDKKLKEKCKIYYVKNLNIFALKEKFFDDFNPFIIFKLFKVLRREKFDIIQLEYPYGFFILKLLSNRKSFLIFDSLGIEGEFVKVSVKEQRFPRILYPIVRIFTKLYEKMVCKLTDVIINISEIDRNYYIENYKINEKKTFLIQIPSSLNSKDILPRTESLKKECRIKLDLPLDKTIVVFHGSIPHPPNEEAFDFIENYIAPEIDYPDFLFVIAGNNLMKYKKDNIISLGFVKNLKDLLYSADFAIVPIISGEGLRVKCSDYIITGLPFISTKKGIQGFDFLQDGEDYLLYDTVNNDFIKGIELLYRDKNLREKFNRNLTKKSQFLEQKNITKRFIKLYSKLINKN